MAALGLGTVQVVQALATVVLALFTVVLALATWRYSNQSQKQTEEMRKTREAKFQPVLASGITHNHPGTYYWFEIENIGKGIAKNVQGRWFVEGMEEKEKEWGVPIMDPGEFYKFHLPIDWDGVNKSEVNGTFKENREDTIKLALEENERDLIVDLEYEDALGNTYNPDPKHLPILKGITQRMDAGEFEPQEI